MNQTAEQLQQEDMKASLIFTFRWDFTGPMTVSSPAKKYEEHAWGTQSEIIQRLRLSRGEQRKVMLVEAPRGGILIGRCPCGHSDYFIRVGGKKSDMFQENNGADGLKHMYGTGACSNAFESITGLSIPNGEIRRYKLRFIGRKRKIRASD